MYLQLSYLQLFDLSSSLKINIFAFLFPVPSTVCFAFDCSNSWSWSVCAYTYLHMRDDTYSTFSSQKSGLRKFSANQKKNNKNHTFALVEWNAAVSQICFFLSSQKFLLRFGVGRVNLRTPGRKNEQN